MAMKKLLFTFILGFALFSVRAQITNSHFQHVTYSGAFGFEDWTAGWANYDPQNTVYPATTVTIPQSTIVSNTTWSPSTSPVVNSASFSDPYLDPTFFEPVTFRGAFGPVDWTAPWAEWDPQNEVYPATTVTIPAGHLTSNTTWTNTNVYKLDGYVYVDSLVTLTIQAGTIIRGDKTNKGTLIILRGGKLIADGTSTSPIVFTSNQSVGNRGYGDWGGIIICGRANTNVPGDNVLIEGGVEAYYGGLDDDDNSGILRFVRIEYPGVAFAPNNEINGLTMGAVGRGTTIDYVQVSFSGDDSFEWFGGNVDGKHLIAHRGWDDDFDVDFGYTGRNQFCVSLRDPNVADVSQSNGFESDNDGSGSTNSPRTAPIFSNVSAFGPKVTPGTTINSNYRNAMHLRRSCRTSIFNSVFAGWPYGLFIDGTNTQTDYTSGVLKIENTFLAGMGASFNDGTPVYDEGTVFNNPSNNNTIYTNNTDLILSDPFNLTNPNFLPTKQVYLLNGWVYIDSTVTLTILPGTIIRGATGTGNASGALIIERGAKLIANGNRNEPIIFTSNQAAGLRNYGDWGGVILCGRGDLNVPGDNVVIEGGVGSYYGGNNDNDTSGVLRYIRIEFPGIAFSPNNEINGLTFGGIGRGTVVDYIQVSYSGDDSFEWFGGAVNCKHLIAWEGWDDDFDTDFGFRGNVQFGVSKRDKLVADQSQSNAFESDNDASGSTNLPLTKPTFSNMSVFGPYYTTPYPVDTIHNKYRRAIHGRRSTSINIYNSLFEGWPIGLFIEGTNAQSNASLDSLRIYNCFMSGNRQNYSASFDSTYYESATSPDRNNTKFTNNASMMITDPYNEAAPNFLPMPASPVLFGSIWVKTISGKVEYELNGTNAGPDLQNVFVVCTDNATGRLISKDTTNSTGDYMVRVTDGLFKLSIQTSKPWGGVSIADAGKIRGWLIAGTPTPIQVLSSDVNEATGITIADVALVRGRIAGKPVQAWTAPDWVFTNPTVNVTTTNVTGVNILGLCSGDANGSYTPPPAE
jgi:hypothetical protein